MIDRALSLPLYLSSKPVFWLLLTFVVYWFALRVHQRYGMRSYAHPVAISVPIIVGILLVSGTPYQTYIDGTQFIHFLLGPATVALAVPLYKQAAQVQKDWQRLFMAAILGSLASISTAMSLAWLLGASPATILSMGAKSVTMPIAMTITEKIGGSPSLTSAFVMLTGIFGAGVAQATLAMAKIPSLRICGFSLGVAAHGIGASRAFQLSQEAGAYAGLAMGLSGLATAALLPLLIYLF